MPYINKSLIKLISSFALFSLAISISCTRNSSPTPPPATLSSDKKINSFVFNKTDNPLLSADIIGVIDQDTIRVMFPYGTALNNLIPTITFSGNSISPSNRTAQNFTNIVTYSVRAEDGTTKTYFVVSKITTNSSKNITSFVFQSANNPALSANIQGAIGTDSVLLRVPFGTNVTNLIPTITIDGTQILPSNLSAQNFTNPIPYIVTAQDGTTKTYIASVIGEPNNGTLYIGSSYGNTTPILGKVYAIDPNTGSLKWQYASSSNSLVSSIEFSNGILYSGIGTNLTAIDTITRTIKWQYTTGGLVNSTPTLSNGIVYVNSDDHFLYAIDAATGNFKWKYQQDNFFGGGNYSSPTVVNGVVYFGSLDGYIYAVDAITGILKWRTYNTYQLGGQIQSSPSVVNGIVYIGDTFLHLLALNANDGSFRWAYQTNSLIFSSPTVVNGVVYVGCADGKLYAVDANTGVLRWSYGTGAAIYDSPIVSDGVVFVGQYNSTNLFAINTSNGTLKWMYANDDFIFSSPVVFNGVVYFGTLGRVVAVNASTGLLKWKFLTPNINQEHLASPCIVDKQGNVYISGISGSQN